VRYSGIRLFTLTLGAIALVSGPMMLPAKAEASRDSRAEKTRTRNHEGGSRDVQSPGPGDLRSSGLTDLRSPTATFPPPLYDDFDRKAGGAGGM
jgi:hypothetical protein